VLSGLAAGDDVYDLMAAAAPSHVPGWFTPDVALLESAVTALDLAYPAGAEPLEYEGLREHYLPEVTIRGRVEHRNSQYAVYAVVIYSRAAAERLTARWRASRSRWSRSRGGSPLGTASSSPRDRVVSEHARRSGRTRALARAYRAARRDQFMSSGAENRGSQGAEANRLNGPPLCPRNVQQAA
jgi:hypothetical protein